MPRMGIFLRSRFLSNTNSIVKADSIAFTSTAKKRVKQFFSRPEWVLKVRVSSLLGLLVSEPLAELICEKIKLQYYDSVYLKNAEVGVFT